MQKIIQELLKFSPRLGQNELATAKFINAYLEKHHISFTLDTFKTAIPIYDHWSLSADNQEIECRPCSLKSGKITQGVKIINSLKAGSDFFNQPNINYNPKCLDSIAQISFFNAPALAVNVNDIKRIESAKTIAGEIAVSWYKYSAKNFIIGNIENSQNLIFSHYDSISQGAVDNAGSVALILEMLRKKQFFGNTSVILAANEEISNDKPVYWGKGYRDFEKKHGKSMESASKIVVVDGIGHKPCKVLQGQEVQEAFPIIDFERYKEKLYWIGPKSIDDIASFYHSDEDTIDKVRFPLLKDAAKIITSLLKQKP